nr:hypothetical protein [Candidatus Sigynarchaeota archaeon]
VIGPFILKFYHPDFPSTVNYTGATFIVYLDSGLTTPLNPVDYLLIDLDDGLYRFSIPTGFGTPFPSPSIKEVYIVASNSSSSPVFIANATASVSFILGMRPVDSVISLNGQDITGQTTISASFGEPVIINVTITDHANGSVAILSLNYSITGGPSGPFTLASGNYSVNVASGNFTTGIHILEILSYSSIYELVSASFLFNIVPRELDVLISANSSLVAVNSVVSSTIGSLIGFQVAINDNITGTPVTGASAVLFVDGKVTGTFIPSASLYELVLNTWSIAPGFHPASIQVTMPNYTSTYHAFILDISRRDIRLNIRVNGQAWDNISSVGARINSVLTFEISVTDDISGWLVSTPSWVLSLPGSLIGVVPVVNPWNRTVSFNTNIVGLGRKVLDFLVSGDAFDSQV